MKKGGDIIKQEDKLFCEQAKRELRNRGWKYAALAKATGYTASTLRAMLCGVHLSEKAKQKIRQALKF